MRVNGGWRARWALLLCALCCLVVGLPAHAAGLNASAGRGYVDQVIQPHETRDKVIRVLRLLRTKRASLPPKKHGNIPL